MPCWIHASEPRRALAALLLALALAVRVLVPAGWMPAQGKGFALTLCSGAGMQTVWLDADGSLKDKAPPAKGSLDQHCAFAFAAPLAGPASAELPAPPAASPAPGFVRALAPSPGRGLAAPPPPATGPPAQA